MIISPRARCIFVHIQKTGGMSVESVLRSSCNVVLGFFDANGQSLVELTHLIHERGHAGFADLPGSRVLIDDPNLRKVVHPVALSLANAEGHRCRDVSVTVEVFDATGGSSVLLQDRGFDQLDAAPFDFVLHQATYSNHQRDAIFGPHPGCSEAFSLCSKSADVGNPVIGHLLQGRRRAQHIAGEFLLS